MQLKLKIVEWKAFDVSATKYTLSRCAIHTHIRAHTHTRTHKYCPLNFSCRFLEYTLGSLFQLSDAQSSCWSFSFTYVFISCSFFVLFLFLLPLSEVCFLLLFLCLAFLLLILLPFEMWAASHTKWNRIDNILIKVYMVSPSVWPYNFSVLTDRKSINRKS